MTDLLLPARTKIQIYRKTVAKIYLTLIIESFLVFIIRDRYDEETK